MSVRRVVDRAPGAPGQLGDAAVAALGDVVGDLVALDAETATVETRRGTVPVSRRAIVAARLAPPSTADQLALEAVAARGWRPAESATVGGWTLRASGGFTGRGNSVLVLRDPGVSLTTALETARQWYGLRGLPLRLQIPMPARRLLDAELAHLGWPAEPDVHVLAARLDQLPASAPAVPVEVTATPDERWFGRYRDGAGASLSARDLLLRHDRAGFASVVRGGAVVAIGRGAVDHGWLGITAVEVEPEVRRRGLAQAVMAALWGWGRAQGASRSYLQVSSDNPGALALYARLGYWRHHDYRYRSDPESH